MKRHLPFAASLLTALLLYALGAVLFGDRHFTSSRVVIDLLRDNAFLGVAALGAWFVIASGGIDLSSGAVLAFSSTLLAVLIERGTPVGAAVIAALASGTTFGLGMGALIANSPLPPFIVTLAGMFLARGGAFALRERSIPVDDALIMHVATDGLSLPLGHGLRLPFTVLMLFLALAIALLIAHGTPFGRAVYAIGSDARSAELLGVRVRRTQGGVYALSGFCSALAGVLYVLYTQSGDPAAAVGFELDAIAAVVIGGTLLTGGSGLVMGAFVGTLVLGLIQTLLNFHGALSSWWTRIAAGALVLLFMALQALLHRRP